MVDKGTYEVYMAFDENGCVVYVGSGQKDRHKHCTSGISHCYGLNKLHFSGKKIEVELVKTDTSKEESILLERELIEKHKPLFNKQFVKDGDDRIKKMQNAFAIKSHTLKWIDSSDYITTKKRMAKKKAEDIFEKYGCLSLIAGVKLSPKEIYFILRPDHTTKKTSLYKILNEIFEAHDKRFLRMREDFIDTILKDRNTTKEE